MSGNAGNGSGPGKVVHGPTPHQCFTREPQKFYVPFIPTMILDPSLSFITITKVFLQETYEG